MTISQDFFKKIDQERATIADCLKDITNHLKTASPNQELRKRATTLEETFKLEKANEALKAHKDFLDSIEESVSLGGVIFEAHSRLKNVGVAAIEADDTIRDAIINAAGVANLGDNSYSSLANAQAAAVGNQLQAAVPAAPANFAIIASD